MATLTSKYEVFILRHNNLIVEKKETWNEVLEFIDFIENIAGGFITAIHEDDYPVLVREVDDEAQEVFWVGPTRKRTTLEEYRATI